MTTSPSPNTEPAPSDIELMQRTRDGDTDAFAELVRRHQNPLVNFFRRLGVHNDAEDLTQETFVRLFRYRERYRATAKLTTFLYLLARQTRIDWLRKHKRRQEFAERLRDQAEVERQDGHGHDVILADAEAALNRLPEGMREVVVLSLYQGMKYEEVGEVLGIPVGTVKSRMFNALRRIRKDLDERSTAS